MMWRRRVHITLFIVLIVGLLFYGFLPKPVSVETARVSRGPLQIVIEEEGKTRLKDRFEISAPVTGTLCRISLDVGDAVTAGQKLCEISPLKSALLDPRSKAEAEDRLAASIASLKEARARVMAAEASAQYSRSEYDRIRKIHQKNLVSLSKLEHAEAEKRRADANLRSSRFAVDTARFNVEEAKKALAHFASGAGEVEVESIPIYAPVDGRVLSVYQESERTVSAGQTLLEVGDVNALEVEVEVLSEDAVRIDKGMVVQFNRWGGEQPLQGIVRVVEPVGFTKVSALGVEEQRVLVIIDITSPPNQWSRLGHGYRVDAQFILWQGHDVLHVPENALFREGNGWAVFVANPKNRAELRKVTPGKRGGLQAQIIEGLDEGEYVVAYPDERIGNEQKIQVRY